MSRAIESEAKSRSYHSQPEQNLYFYAHLGMYV